MSFITKDLIRQLDAIYARGEKPVHCLLVEDDQDDGNLTMRVLKRVGVKTHWAKTGDDAMALLTASKDPEHPDFDIVFLDLVLKGGGAQGEQIFKRVRAEFPSVHIVLLTGNVTHNILDLINSSRGIGGYVGLVPKPLKKDDAEEVLTKHHLPIVVENQPERNQV